MVAGDLPAFEDSFSSMFAVAYRVAFRVLGDRAEAEDVAQESLVRAYDRWRRVADDPHPWVSTVAGRRAIDVLRSRRRAQAREERTTRTAAPLPGAEQEVAARVDLQRALSTLPRRQREVLLLRYVADLPDADVAGQLGISTGSVKKHAARALAALRNNAPQVLAGADPHGQTMEV